MSVIRFPNKSHPKSPRPSAETLRRLYWDDKLSWRKIAEIYDVNPQRIRGWMKYYGIPRRTMKECGVLAPDTIHPNLEPSEDLSYVLGVLYGDAYTCNCKGARFLIGLRVVNKTFADQFANSLGVIGLHPFVRTKQLKTTLQGREYDTQYWVVIAHSRKFYNWFNSLNEIELGKLLSQDKFKLAFLRGLYESEGSCGYWKRGKKIGKSWVMRIVMTDWDILNLSRQLFRELGYQFCLTKSHKTCTQKQLYSLEINGQKVPEIMKILKPSIKGIHTDVLE